MPAQPAVLRRIPTTEQIEQALADAFAAGGREARASLAGQIVRAANAAGEAAREVRDDDGIELLRSGMRPADVGRVCSIGRDHVNNRYAKALRAEASGA